MRHSQLLYKRYKRLFETYVYVAVCPYGLKPFGLRRYFIDHTLNAVGISFVFIHPVTDRTICLAHLNSERSNIQTKRLRCLHGDSVLRLRALGEVI